MTVRIANLPKEDLFELATDLAATVGKTAYIIQKDDGEVTVTTQALHKKYNFWLLASIKPELKYVKP